MSQETDAAAIIAAINAQFSTPRAFDLDDAKTQTENHVIVFVLRRYVDGKMSDGSASARGGRVVTRYVGKSVGDVRNMRERTTSALEEKTLSGDVGPFSFELEQESLTFDSDDGGWFVAADSWVF